MQAVGSCTHTHVRMCTHLVHMPAVVLLDIPQIKWHLKGFFHHEMFSSDRTIFRKGDDVCQYGCLSQCFILIHISVLASSLISGYLISCLGMAGQGRSETVILF